MNDRIWVAGDLHGDFQCLLEQAVRERPRAIVLLGDVEAPRPLQAELAPLLGHTEILFILGNHDTDSPRHYANLIDSAIGEGNLHGRVRNVAGVRIAGLGGVFRRVIWDPHTQDVPAYSNYTAFLAALNARRPLRERSGAREHRTKKELTHLSSIFWDDVERLANQKADILICHEAPSCHPNGFTVIDRLARAMGVHTVFHGHHHDCLNYEIDWTRLGFRAFGVGFGGITEVDGGTVIPGAFDMQCRGYVNTCCDPGQPSTIRHR